MEKNNIAECPNCGGEIRFKKVPFIGQDVICRQCNINLVVVEKTPIELDWGDYDEEYVEVEDEYGEEDSRSRLSRN